MSDDSFTPALETTLKEIKRLCPEIQSSFIFEKDGAIVAGDPEASDITVKKALHLFQDIKEKADSIGGIHELSVYGAEGNIQISQVNEMYLATATSKGADTKHLQAITGVIVPTVLKLLKKITQPPAPKEIAQQLTAKKITGFFAGDSAEVDQTLLKDWSKSFRGKTIDTVQIQAPAGKTTQCKVKAIDEELEGKGLIRIPDKTIKRLGVKEGALVRVEPIIQ